MTPESISDALRDYCLSRPNLVEVWFHGSRFFGGFLDDSDLDLYFEFDAEMLRNGWDLSFDYPAELDRLKTDVQPLFDLRVHATYAHTIFYTDGLRAAAMSGALIYCRPGWEPVTPSERSG